MYQINKEEYPLLHLFKDEIDIDKSSPQHKPYTFQKTPILVYRMIFLTIGVIYFIFVAILLSKSLSWTCGLIFGNSLAVKSTLLSICGSISLSSILMGLCMTTEKETVKSAVRQAKKEIKRIHERKLTQNGVKRFFANEQDLRKSTAFKQHFQDTVDQLFFEQKEATRLVDRISKSDSMNREAREELFNQAIIELRRKLDHMIQVFERATPSKHLLIPIP